MQNESQTIQDILAGADRYGELIERYHVGLIIHCERIVSDRGDAEDIAQEAFVRAYLQLTKYQETASRFSTWLYKIATNLALDHLRKHKRTMTVEDVEALAAATMPTYLEDEERAAIRRAVINLVPPEYRRVIESYYWDGKSYQQIADEENIPLNTLRTWLRRAKIQLREDIL